ncbi:MAG TPA: gluconate 2-dehydrogenase subunit 3 family protein [Puia sp.]|nr:gluconate 2-dehydrogenase subunit 3 family protein [Puia sp.]
MNRRSAVKNLVIASGGLITLPFWMEACNTPGKEKDAKAGTHPSSFSPDEQDILAGATDAIIPAGKVGATSSAGVSATAGSPGAADSAAAASAQISAGAAGASIGALSVGVDKFLQKMIDDCYEQPVQDNVKKQLLALDASARKGYGHSFAASTLQQRQALLLKLQDSKNKEEKDFFELIKSETIRGFNTSQKVMEEYYHYKVAPGHYYGCITVKA